MYFFTSPDNFDLIVRLQKTYGEEIQLVKSIEEFSELTAELSRYLGGNTTREDVLHEFFDAIFMIQQIQYLLNISSEEAEEYMRNIRTKMKELLDESV